MKSIVKKIGKLLLFAAPYLIGFAGFLLAGEPLLHAAFSSFSLYTMGYGDVPPNILLEIARWIGPLVTASSILLVFAALRHRIQAFFTYLRGNSTAVYGPEKEKKELLKQLGTQGIEGKDKFLKARRYILVGSEEENLTFYHKNMDSLKNAEVYLKCTSIPAQASMNSNLHLFCPEETAARLFWKENCLYSLCSQRYHKLRVVMLGFGKLGHELITSALQNNIFFPDQYIEYHIFGDDGSYAATHTQLKMISDPVFFHSEPWYENLDVVKAADMTIVLEQTNQLPLLQQLLFTTLSKNIHVFSAGSYGVEVLSEHDRLICHDWMADSAKLENIIGATLFERAKRINLRYAHLYTGVEETDENKEAEWASLNAFTRYSNIGSADYHEIQRKFLSLEGVYSDGGNVPDGWLETLAELEHLRWTRYHFLNNWRYAPPVNGKNKDTARRTHALLVDYKELPNTEKEKDRENIRILFSIN